MFRFLNDVDDDPYMMDPFAAHRQQMSLFAPFGMDPFALAPQMQPHRAPRRQAGPLTPFGMMGMGGGFMDMFGMMGEMMENMERMSGSPSCQTFSSSTVISYSSSDIGAPKVYQQTSETRTGPGGIRETRQSMRDSESGFERLAIGHHIGDRAHIMERSRNRRTGDREERQDFINLDESEAAAFDEEWRREAGRYAPQTPGGSTTAGIDGQAASSWLLLPLLAQRRHQVIGMSPQDTVSPTPAPVTTAATPDEATGWKESRERFPDAVNHAEGGS
ncbi:hypothetical protein INR49_001639 [Caranx melampygus]|nr:hypothetical protein INR49_001639 [Caranx melampygus]